MKIVWEKTRVRSWLTRVFGKASLQDVEERGLRFGEESLELIQSLGVTREQALALVKQVYDKPAGEPQQELGGTLVTLASLCVVAGLDADDCYRREFMRCEQPDVMEKIRRKHAEKAVVSSNFAQRP